jgi:ribosomal protein S27AE
MNVLQHTETKETVDTHRPNCPECGLAMWLFAHIPEDIAKAVKERRTYVCEVCGTTETVHV